MEPMTSPKQGWQSQKDLNQGMKVGTRQGRARRGSQSSVWDLEEIKDMLWRDLLD